MYRGSVADVLLEIAEDYRRCVKDRSDSEYLGYLLVMAQKLEDFVRRWFPEKFAGQK